MDLLLILLMVVRVLLILMLRRRRRRLRILVVIIHLGARKGEVVIPLAVTHSLVPTTVTRRA